MFHDIDTEFLDLKHDYFQTHDTAYNATDKEKDRHPKVEQFIKKPNQPLKNLYRNTLTDLHFNRQKLVSLGFVQTEKKKRNIPVVINAGIFSHILGIASVSDIDELKEKIDQAII